MASLEIPNHLDSYEFNRLTNIKKYLNDYVSHQENFFDRLTNQIEDLIEYVGTFEDQIKELNTRLIDNSDEHIDLVKKFIEEAAAEISNKGVKQYFSKIESLGYKVETIERLIEELKESILTLSQENRELKELRNNKNLILEKEVSSLQEVIFWQSLPLKIVQDFKTEQYSAYTAYGDWIKITDETFHIAMKTKYFFLDKCIGIDDNYITTFKKIPLKTSANALLFNLV